ncbi:MAG TPA: DegV family protein [Anaerolineae bacterium]|nr:DegV family protein [Anaerolineae bacterium]
MAQVKIITDSTADLSPELAEALGITVLPLTIQIGNKSYREGIDLNAKEFFSKIAHTTTPPLLTAPSVAQFEQTFDELMKETDEIVAILNSSKLSKTFQNAQRAASPLMGRAKLRVIDSQLITTGLGMIVTNAARAAEQGADVEEVVRLTRGLIPRTYIAAFADTLDYLEHSGRIRKAQAILGTMLNIKPLLILEEGEIVVLEKVRTRAKAVEKLVEFIIEFTHIEKMDVLHSTTPEDVALLIEQVNLQLPNLDMKVEVYGPSLGVFLGPGALGVVVYEGT